MSFREILKRNRLLYKIGYRIHEWQYARENSRRVRLLQSIGRACCDHVSRALSAAGFQVFLNYGSLLGFMRAGAFMSFDNDIDYGLILTDDFDFDRFHRTMVNIGCKPADYFIYDSQTQELSYTYKGLGIDFFVVRENTDGADSYWFQRFDDLSYPSLNAYTPMHMPTVRVSPTQTMRKGDFEAAVPAHPEDLLQNYYTKNWRIPDPDWSWMKGPVCRKLEGEIAYRYPITGREGEVAATLKS